MCVCVCACVRACAGGRRRGLRELYCGVIERTTTTLYGPRKEFHWYEIWILQSWEYSHCVPIRRAAERDGSAFGRSRHPEVMVFLRPSWTAPSVRLRPRPLTCFPFHCGPILCRYQCCQRYSTTVFGHAVCPSVRMEQLSSYWTDCHEILYLSNFRKICRAYSIFIKIWQNIYSWPHLAQFFFE